MAWPPDILVPIAATDDLHVSPFRDDGVTYGTPTWICSVVVDGQLYARAYHGQRSRWYRAAVQQGAGRISAAGAIHDVTFEAVGGDLNDAIDAAYRAKYRTSPYLEPMIGNTARAARCALPRGGSTPRSAT